ncbi:MAG: BspA family leucine-rich repeat surface protein, partial [Bacteroidales bacterium]
MIYINKETKYVFFVCAVTLLVIGFTKPLLAQSPNLEMFSSANADGRYNTGEQIDLEAKFDDWLGFASEIKVRLNTGDTITMSFNPKLAADFIDSAWGIAGKRNAVMYNHSPTYSNGVHCVLELEGKGGHTENKGKMVIAGGFYNYEEYPGSHDMLVITDADGQLLQGFGDRLDASNDKAFNFSVGWVCETQDGGLVVVGEFYDYGKNPNYDYIVKFKPQGGEFVIDTAFMNKLTSNDTYSTADGQIPASIEGYGKPQSAVVEDSDGSLFISGMFSNVGGFFCPRIAKINADGTVNTDFNYPTTNYGSIFGGTCITLDTSIPGKFWWGTIYKGVYILDKTTGAPAVDQDGNSIMDINDNAAGPLLGVLGITVLPPKGTVDGEGHVSPGGVVVTGRGTPNSGKVNPATNDTYWGWYTIGGGGINALQNDLTATPITDFALGGLSSYLLIPSFLRGWGLDGMATAMKGKIWIGVQEAILEEGYSNPDTSTYPNFYEGGLAVLNCDGSFNTHFNYMLANTSENAYEYNASRPDGAYPYDGIGGTSSGGAMDVMTMSLTSDDKLMVGGNYGSMMEYIDDDIGTSMTANANPDDQMITRLGFNSARGVYTVSSEDLTNELKIIEVISHSGNGAFGSAMGTAVLPSIPELVFENRHRLSINVPYVFPEDNFITTWKTTTANEKITIPIDKSGTYNYDFYVNWGDTINGVPQISHFTTADDPSYVYATPGTYTIKIFGSDSDGDDISDGAGFPRILFPAASDEDKTKIMTVEQWGAIKWASMANAFTACSNLDVLAVDVPNLSNVADMSSMFDGCSKLKGNTHFGTWNVSNVTTMSSMFQNATSFDQNIGAWNISSLATAANMFNGATLSVANYDSLLIGWNDQVELGTAKPQVQFHGGFSKYCAGEAARANMIDEGWGDGIVGTSGGYADIVDGGSIQPQLSVGFSDDTIEICIGSSATLSLSGSETDVYYQLYDLATDLAVGDSIDGAGSSINFTVSPTDTTFYYVVARSVQDSTGACVSEPLDTIVVNISPKSVGGNISSSDTRICAGDSVDLDLNNFVGDVLRWESSSDNFVSNIVKILHADSLYNTGSLMSDIYYRVLLKSGVCDSAYSDTVRINVDHVSVGGMLSASITDFCASAGGADGTSKIVLTNEVGVVLTWQSSSDGINFTDITGTGSNQSYIPPTTSLHDTVYFRVQVQSGACGVAYSDTIRFNVS